MARPIKEGLEAFQNLDNKILDILRKLSIDFTMTDNYTDQWRNKKFYLDNVYYEGREVRIEDIKDLIVSEIKIKDVPKIKITSLFKKWFVKRPNGQCQILFSIYELDKFVDEILSEIRLPD